MAFLRLVVAAATLLSLLFAPLISSGQQPGPTTVPLLRTDSMAQFTEAARLLNANNLWVKPATVGAGARLAVVPIPKELQVSSDICVKCVSPNPPEVCKLLLCRQPTLPVDVRDIVVPKWSLCGACDGKGPCFCDKNKPNPLDPNFGLHKQILELQRLTAEDLLRQNRISMPEYRSVLDAYRTDSRLINQLRQVK